MILEVLWARRWEHEPPGTMTYDCIVMCGIEKSDDNIPSKKTVIPVFHSNVSILGLNDGKVHSNVPSLQILRYTAHHLGL